MKQFECIKCGHILLTNEDHPKSPNWSDGHRCIFRLFVEQPDESILRERFPQQGITGVGY